MPYLGHGHHHGGVEVLGGIGARRADHDASGAVARHEGGGHLRPAGVVHAHEEDLGWGRDHAASGWGSNTSAASSRSRG